MHQLVLSVVAIFQRLRTESTSSPTAPVRAALGAAGGRNYMALAADSNRSLAMAVPTISRGRDLLASLVASCDIRQYSLDALEARPERVPMVAESWMARPDRNLTRGFLLAWTFDDLLFYGRAFWAVSGRYATGYPAEFSYLPASAVSTPDQAGPVFYGPSPVVNFVGREFAGTEVIQFLSPIQGVIYSAGRPIRIAHALDKAAERFAVNEVPAGWLKQTSGEPLSGDDLAELAATWAAARSENAIGALNEYVDWRESSMDPSRLQLIEARQHQALELARVVNCPPYLVGAPTSSMTYQNAQQARWDLVTFGARPYIDCIEQTLSADHVLPRGRYAELGLEAFLIDPLLGRVTNGPAAL